MTSDQTMYTYNRQFAAHLGNTGGVVTIPDQIADDQDGADAAGTIFPALDDRGNELRVRLDGAAYGLHTSGTGDCVVVEVETE